MGWFSNIGAGFGLPFVGSTALAIGGSILDYMGTQQTNQQNAENARWANASSAALAQQNLQMEREFAQNGITWRIQDAARNGIAPLAALGASEPSFSPVSSVFQFPQYESPLHAIGSGMRDAGQNLSRALSAQRSPEEKAMDKVNLVRAAKENDLLDAQIRLANLNVAKAAGTPPGIPKAWMEIQNRDGTVSVVPTEEAARTAHGESFGPLLWSAHNGVIPQMQLLTQPEIPDVRGERFFGPRGNYWPTGR